MTDKEKKAYIIKNWKISSGTKITKMLKRYWASSRGFEKSGGKKEKDIIAVAEKIFS